MVVTGYMIYFPRFITNSRASWVTLTVFSVNGQVFKVTRHMKGDTRYYVHHVYDIMLLSNHKRTFSELTYSNPHIFLRLANAIMKFAVTFIISSTFHVLQNAKILTKRQFLCSNSSKFVKSCDTLTWKWTFISSTTERLHQIWLVYTARANYVNSARHVPS